MSKILRQQEEVLKCAQDPVYFIKTYLRIQHPVKGRIPFDLFKFQEQCIEDFENYRFNVILKSRQLGLSTVTAAYCLWFALFHRDKNIVIMATQLDTSIFMVNKVRAAWETLPEWMARILGVTKLEAEAKKHVHFSNGSKITAIPTKDNSGRGDAVSLFVVDEAAHVENLGEIWKSIRPTLSTGGSAIVFSTPKGKGNYFFELWEKAETDKFGKEVEWRKDREGLHATQEGSNGFHAIRLPWTVHPERDDDWYETETKDMDERGIAQELLCSFESSGHTYFRQEDIAFYRTRTTTPIITEDAHGMNGDELHIWKGPKMGGSYLICADIARGDAEDNSAAHVFDIEADEQVAEFYGKIPTDEFGVFLDKLGRRYNTARIIIEKNTYGIAVGNELRRLRYPNMYYEPKIAELLDGMTEEERWKQLPGHTTTSKNREDMLVFLERVIRNRLITLYSDRLREEMDSFIYNGKKGKAAKGKRDDLIMALAVALVEYQPKGAEVRSDGTTSFAVLFLAGFSRSSSAILDTSSRTQNPFVPIAPKTSNDNPFMPKNNSGKKQYPNSPAQQRQLQEQQLIRQTFGWLF
jgi:hypothetical protein